MVLHLCSGGFHRCSWLLNSSVHDANNSRFGYRELLRLPETRTPITSSCLDGINCVRSNPLTAFAYGESFTFSTAFLEEPYASQRTRLLTMPGGCLSFATEHGLASSCWPSAPACSVVLRAGLAHSGCAVLMACPIEVGKRATGRERRAKGVGGGTGYWGRG